MSKTKPAVVERQNSNTTNYSCSPFLKRNMGSATGNLSFLDLDSNNIQNGEHHALLGANSLHLPSGISVGQVILRRGTNSKEVSDMAAAALIYSHKLVQDAKSQISQYNQFAIEDGERQITASAIAAALDWIDSASNLPQVYTYDLSFSCTGMDNGGSIIVIYNSKNRNQFTLRFSADGRFMMASKVNKKLIPEIVTQGALSAEEAIQWVCN